MITKILVIDDEIDIQDLFKARFRKELRRKELEFVFVHRAEEVVSILENHPEINILLCDINMPGMTGLELLIHLNNFPRLLKIIMVTAYGNIDNIRTAMNGGAFDFITKPIDFSDLKLTVQKALQELEKQKEGEAAKKQLPITQKELEETDQKARYLEELDQLKTRFFTNISHEFRTPLTVILGMLDQMVENPDRWFDKGTLMIRRNANQLIDLINQILDLQKLESGKLKLNLVQSEIVGFTKYLSESFSSLAESKGITLSFHAKETEIWMDFDSEKTLRIYTNLLSNAIKFTPKGGKVDIHISKIETGNEAEPFALISVEDSGIGISEEQLPYIFDRFYQAHEVFAKASDSTNEEGNAVVKEGEGSGIGLALIKELVQLMNGKIEVKSNLDQGTNFTLTLPITNHAPKEKPKTLDNPSIPTNDSILTRDHSSVESNAVKAENLPNLLIIEDNPDVLEYLIACLEDQYFLLSATDGQEGIDIALEQIPDLILSDVMMPRKDGFQVCDTLKNDDRTSHIPIILLTAKSDQDSRIQGLKRGADAYLAKPFDKEELLIRLEMLLEIRRKLQNRYAKTDIGTLQESESFEYEDQFISRVYQILEENMLDEHFNVPKLCKLIGMSRTTIHRKVKALTGKSITLFVRSYRLIKAKKILETTDLPISEIGYRIGFIDPAHFSRAFSNEFGISPRKMRDGIR